jgi:hypothetical protein
VDGVDVVDDRSESVENGDSNGRSLNAVGLLN